MSEQTTVAGLRGSSDVTAGRVAMYFGVRYLTPLLVVLALAAAGATIERAHLVGVLTAQIAVAIASHAVAIRQPRLIGCAVTVGMVADLTTISIVSAMAGGAGGSLTFLFTLYAVAAGVLLSSRAGLRALGLGTVALIVGDMGTEVGAMGAGELPPGLQGVAALWVLGGSATLFSRYNEQELRRRNAELATVRQVTLDIENTLSLSDVLRELCDGVTRGFGFDAAAVLLRDGDEMRCVASSGVTGTREAAIEVRGRIAQALAAGTPVVTSGDDARRDGSLVPLVGPRGYVAVAIAADGLLIATRSGRRRRPALLRAREIDTLDGLAHHARLAIANARLHEQVSEMAVTDPMTGLANHGEFQRRLAEQTGRLQRYASLRGEAHRLSVLLLDIDHFKRFNDKFGHPAGDEVLRAVAGALQGAVRAFDVVARYGGEEFAVVLPETPAEAALEVAERIRSSVAACSFPYGKGKPARVTASIGVATAPEDGATPAELVKRADAALYHSKEAGRDRVTHAQALGRAGARVVRMETARRRRSAAR